MPMTAAFYVVSIIIITASYATAFSTVGGIDCGSLPVMFFTCPTAGTVRQVAH